MEIKARGGVDPVLARVVEEYLVNHLGSSVAGKVVGRDDIQQMLDHEQRKQLLGCEEESCLAEIGGAMGVDRLLAGSMDKVGGSILISLKLIDAHSATVVARESERLQGATEEDALDAVTALSQRIFERRQERRDLPVLAVTEMKARRGIDPVIARVVEEHLAGEIAKLGIFSVIGRDDISRLVDLEQQKQLLGCSAESCLAEIGGALGAAKLLAGSIDRVGESILLSLKVIDVKRAEVERRESVRLRGATEEDALDGVSTLFRRLFATEIGESKQAAAPASAPAPATAAPATAAPDKTTQPAPSARLESESEGGGRVWTWVTAALAVGALGAGIGLEVVAAADRDEIDKLIRDSRQPGNDVTYDDITRREEEHDQKAISGHVLLGVAGALAITSIILIFVEGDDGLETRQAGALQLVPGIGPTTTGLLLRGRF